MTDWFYEENGQPRGPVSERDLATMFANRLLSAETRVWTTAFGNEWRSASQTTLAKSAGVMPPPLPAASATTAQPPQTQAATGYSPPYVPPSDVWAYLLAFSPLVFVVLEVVLYKQFGGKPGDAVPAILYWLGPLPLVWADARNLYLSRRNPQKREVMPFVLLTPFAYFWRRWAITRTSIKFLWIWIACFVAYAVAMAALSDG
nr:MULTISPECIES: DUF4339 domain-containing protein [Mesorhizobium]